MKLYYKVIPTLIVALFATWRGPNILAKLKITREEMIAANYEKSQALETTDSNNPGSSKDTACCGSCFALFERINAFYSDASLKRKGVMMVSVR